MARERDPNVKIQATNETDKAFKGAQENMRNLASTAAILEGPLGAVAGRINAVGAALGRVNPLVLTAGVGFAALIAAQTQAIPVAIEYEKQLFRIESQLQLLGNSAGFTVDQLDALSQSVARATLASETGVRQAQSVLLQFSVGTRENFVKLIDVAQDMASVFGGDIATNARKLGRALEDPRKGLESLQRYVPTLTPDFVMLTTAMFENGEVAEAQALIMDKLLSSFNGQGKAEGKGLAGHTDSLAQSWRNLLIVMAQTSVIKGAVIALDELLINLNNGFDEAIVAQEKYKKLQIELNKLENPTFRQRQRGLRGEAKDERIAALKAEMAEMRRVREETDKAAGAIQEKADIELKAENAYKKFVASRLRSQKQDADINEFLTQKLKERNKEIRKVGAAYDELWKRAQPPVEKLKLAYTKDAINIGEAIKLGVVGAEEGFQALLRVEAKYHNDRNKLEGKFSRVDKLISRFEEEQATEEQSLRVATDRRKAMVQAALDDEENLTKDRKKRLNALLVSLEVKLSEDLRAIRLNRTAELTGQIGDLIGIAADYYADIERRTTRNVNEEYTKRADIIRENIEKGVISVDRGNQQLKALENQRQAQLNADARKSFERSKKLRRAQALAAAGQLIISAAAHAAETGGYVAAIASGVLAAAFAAKQLHAINTVQYEGGGSIPSVSSGGSAGATQAAGPSETPLRASFTIIGNQGSTFTFDQLVQLAGELSNLSRDFDIQVIDPDSRNAQDIINASQGNIAI